MIFDISLDFEAFSQSHSSLSLLSLFEVSVILVVCKSCNVLQISSVSIRHSFKDCA
jgi:hypothetical protein